MYEKDPDTWGGNPEKMLKTLAPILKGTAGLFNDTKRNEIIRISRKYAKALKENFPNLSEEVDNGVNNYEDVMKRAIEKWKRGIK